MTMENRDGPHAAETDALHLDLGLLHGDGIGPEIVDGTAAIIEAAVKTVPTLSVSWDVLPIGHTALASAGDPIPRSTLDALEGLDAWILGPHDNSSYPESWRGSLSPGGTIRKHFDLYANVRPARAFVSTHALSPQMDLVVVRENTEGFYADRNMYAGSGEFMPTPDVAMAVAVVTRAATTRIAHHAFQLAQLRRKHVTIAHKMNVLAMTTGLFRDVCVEVGRQYPDVDIDEQHIDALAARMASDGDQLDVIVAENMFGDILSDLAGALAGSLGIAPSLNASDSKAMAQAAHGAAPDIAGKNVANPTALIMSSTMLLRWLDKRHTHSALTATADRIDAAVRQVIENGVTTPDLGGSATTGDFVSAVTAVIDGGHTLV